ncbi:hypothetical protein CFK41_10785 [Brachybacterium ginsengisoli]|uniref:DUF5129 domain-containing protein n=1 Tax=Brachybacterium ginsengisoli TaxID=1331682 RepID=A0A291GY88_9MICO|nr:DUF5129 domain-containing protein [Brachybacterium ginsengisoli]ATG55189.1 hypothetical protein CFK41_10785 [Brachybacterium ginsengisoli]
MAPQLQTAPPPDARSVRAVAATSLTAALLLLLAALSPFGAAALAVPPGAVTVHDTTGTVDSTGLSEDLAQVDFRREVDLVVLVVDVTDHGHSSAEDTALNDTVRDVAQEDLTELLSADGDHFADGTVIIALDPDNRFLGTYAGEDVKLSDDGFSAVQDAMRGDARDADWEATLEAGAEKYAALLDRPWWQHPVSLVAAAVAACAAAATGIGILGLRRGARRRVDEALPRYGEVLSRREITDSAARTLPATSPYAQAVLRQHETYTEQISTAERLHADLPVEQDRTWGWGFSSEQRRIAHEFSSTVESLDEAEGEIIAAADLLHRIGQWRAAWDRELEPLRDSLTQLDELTADPGADGASPEEEAALAELRALGEDASAEMDSLTARLEADEIDPDSALEALDTLTRELSAAVARLQGHRINHLAEDEEEAEVLREAAEEVEDSDYRTLRGRRHVLESPAGQDQFWNLSPVLWYASWRHESTGALDIYRNPPSSSGSTSGYSGGGFSGAGSSSRF